MSKQDTQHPHPPHGTGPGGAAVALPPAPAHTSLLPKPLYIAFALTLLFGIAMYTTRDSRLISGTLSDLNGANASMVKSKKSQKTGEDKETDINDGLLDEYGSVAVKNNNESVGSFLSLCDINPPAALQVFRKSLDEGNKSAKLIALYSTFFMVPKCGLDKTDLQRLIDHLDPDKEKDEDLRRVAQKALSDLIHLKNVSAKATYETLPADIKTSSDDWPANNVVVREETRSDGTKELRIRWSNPNTAFAWWKQFGDKAQWAPDRNALEIP